MSGVAPLRSFELRCWARAFMLRACMFPSFAAAFGPLWDEAQRDGLLAQYGAPVLLAIIEDAHRRVFNAEVDE